jgi:DNA-binding NarL/FixJ family response regulator
MTYPIQILIADDHFTVRESLSRALDSEDDFEVVGMAPDGQAAVEMAANSRGES